MTQVQEKADFSRVLTELADVLDSRREASPQTSYVSQLLHAGEDKILKKVIEEAGEVLMASKDGDKQHLVKEVADVWFHTMVLLTYHQIRVEDVLQELQQRQNVSGLTEKASRQPQ
ncbi:phosphoribosyl-ATP diphosphatase [Snodgrassella alvi]|uniref:phosphoribosyl-ATP diphosphatase n=1 Tax=Snodgrassella TaxID=1193515 RepID=UPI0009FF24D5|nr:MULTISPECIES: phosphoribosyl-ATP diphosphatase [Snodgrassella]MBI0165585.1 phosphoribosyl-ATP diphosphatase [Snodgrassella sp. M0351]ORF26481.1 phosphoribosyl-ATP diphosphatase [Snodgrassella alvi]ORF30453.1 phosphoribosyl-ATP diphosphatase [Snodgrassella alvi]ORF34143.1 phosphoribosyl-ATP diphosphatase [Snodgrassella alvi]ORF38029.1 phosphoribosyl-ATP diphosphatase [Snodgrassella alvi]